MITCKVGENIINCYDGTYNKEQLKKWASKNILICPVCDKPYEYCHGEFVSPYFRHKEKSQCEDKYSEPESQEHINGKRDLYEWIKTQDGVTEAILEGWLPETKQRPDIMFKYNGKQYVIEYQCTPIASEYLERHELYQAGGIKDIWILGTDKYLNKIKQDKTNRKKVIEKHTDYYYDSRNKVFVFGELSQKFGDYMTCQLILTHYCDDNYSNLVKNINTEYLSIDLDSKYFTDINYICLTTDGIKIKNNIINDISKFTCQKIKLKNQAVYDAQVRAKEIDDIINKCVQIFNNKYIEYNDDILLKEGFYYCGKCLDFNNYKFFIHSNRIDFCESYTYTKPFTGRRGGTGWRRETGYKKLNTFNFIDVNINDFIYFINECLKDEIDQKIKYIKHKKEKIMYLEKYMDKPIYLLSQHCELDKKIRFKFLKDYGNIGTLDLLKSELDFLTRIKAEKFVFMIPTYRYIETGSLWKSKLRNYLNDAISEITSFGFKVLTYDDLKEELNEKTTTILHNEVSTR